MTHEDDELQTENVRLRRLLAQAGIDAAASDTASRLQKLLIAELHHRVKNLLAMVLSITSQTLRSAASLDDAREAIQNRIMILSRSFDLLIESEMDAVPLATIIEDAAEPYNEDRRVLVSVPDVQVAALPALSIALVVNELCTNAVKYGALSNGGGSVGVTGALDDGVLALIWTESGGPAVGKPSPPGFGTRMIRSVIPASDVDMQYLSHGLVCRIRVPSGALLAET